MELELRSCSSYEDAPLEQWVPGRLEEVFVQVELEIGIKGERGADLFYVRIATPEGIRAAFDRWPDYKEPDRALLVFSDYTWDALLARLTRIVSGCARDTWAESALCLTRHFEWEYDDFVIDPDLDDPDDDLEADSPSL
jgi:hypothetical protein